MCVISIAGPPLNLQGSPRNGSGSAKGRKGYGPARGFQFRNTMLPVVSRLAIEMIDGSWRQRRGDAFEPIPLLATKAHGSRLAQRDADDMAENRPVTMPADPRAWIVANEESLDDLFRCEPGITGGARPDWQQPLRDWVGRRECAGFEIIAPAIAARQPLATAGSGRA